MKKNSLQESHGIALVRVTLCLAAVAAGVGLKSGYGFYEFGGAYIPPFYVKPLIAVLAADICLYGGLLCLISLSLSRSLVKGGKASILYKGYTQLSEQVGTESDATPMRYQV